MGLLDRVHAGLAGVEGIDAAEQAGDHPTKVFRELLSYGIADLMIDKGNGSGGARMFCDAISTIARTWLSLAESVHLQSLVAATVAAGAGPSVGADVLDDLRSGRKIGANCISEPTAGSDMGAIALCAERTEDGYVLNGTKTWVGHAPIADLLVVYARTRGTGLTGITCFLIDADTPGVEVGQVLDKHAAAALPSADIDFRDVAVPTERLLSRPDRGARLAEVMLVQGRLGLAAAAVGLADAAAAHAVRYAKSRVQFGVPVIRHQGVGFQLADMATQIDAARALVRSAADDYAAGAPTAVQSAAKAKLFATDTAAAVTSSAVQVFGAEAYRAGVPAERHMREAKLLQILQGTNHIQRLVIAERL
ncbi:MAG: acyl-CoA dehydrogenase family protein [Actinomycetota bacterium]|nr:acyl-CoA dehydrogenase family protein [Actinomycetota bacterium]